MTWDPAVALEEERRRTRERLEDLVGDYAGIVEASTDSNADDEHDPEGSTIAFERSQIGALVRQARDHLAEIADAVGRIEAGAYAREWGVDLPEIADWVWPDAGDAAGDTASASTGGDNE